MSFGSRLQDLAGPFFLLCSQVSTVSTAARIRGRSNLQAPCSYRPAIGEVDISVFLMGSVIRAWQGLGGLKLTRLMAEQTAQSQAALPMSFTG